MLLFVGMVYHRTYELISGVAPETVPFLGWPQVSEENYVPPVEEPVPDVVEEVNDTLEVIIKKTYKTLSLFG